MLKSFGLKQHFKGEAGGQSWEGGRGSGSWVGISVLYVRWNSEVCGWIFAPRPLPSSVGICSHPASCPSPWVDVRAHPLPKSVGGGSRPAACPSLWVDVRAPPFAQVCGWMFAPRPLPKSFVANPYKLDFGKKTLLVVVWNNTRFAFWILVTFKFFIFLG